MVSVLFYRLAGLCALLGVLFSMSASAGGEIGDHVNHLSDNLENYAQEVHWLTGKIDGLVSNYEKDGVDAVRSDSLVDFWEAVDFHAAIESNYVPVYAAIWQGLYGVKDGIEEKRPATTVRQEQAKLEQALWQALGAVKLAAQFQDRGLLEKVALRQGGPANSSETLSEIKSRLDRVLAKYAEQLPKEAVTIVHNTYLNLFEGLEGELIAENADLVEDLEKDFNVTLPLAIQDDTGVDNVRSVIVSMQAKLDDARLLLEKAEQSKKDVF